MGRLADRSKNFLLLMTVGLTQTGADRQVLYKRYQRERQKVKQDQVLMACLIDWRTNMGLKRMGEISDIGYPLLAAASNNFIRLETLKKANDRVSNSISKLSIFHHLVLMRLFILVAMDRNSRRESIRSMPVTHPSISD